MILDSLCSIELLELSQIRDQQTGSDQQDLLILPEGGINCRCIFISTFGFSSPITKLLEYFF